MDIWCRETGELKPLVKCFISIGIGKPGRNASGWEIKEYTGQGLRRSILDNWIETEQIAKDFMARWGDLYDTDRYFRFNVEEGLDELGVSDYGTRFSVEAATEAYLDDQARVFQVQNCVRNLEQKEVINEEMASGSA